MKMAQATSTSQTGKYDITQDENVTILGICYDGMDFNLMILGTDQW